MNTIRPCPVARAANARPQTGPLLWIAALGSLCSDPALAAKTESFRGGERGYAGATDVTLSTQNARWSGGNGATDREGPLSCYHLPGDKGYETRALLRFDRLTLPKGARVTAAALTLTFDNWSTGLTVRGYYVKAQWSPASRKLGWLSRDDAHGWAAGGADAKGKDVLKEPTFAVTELAGRGDEVVTVPLDPRIVEGWAREPAQNQGLLLVNETEGLVTRVHSTEDKDPAKRPLLAITYELPGEKAAAPAAEKAPAPAPASPGAQAQRAAGRPRLFLTPPILDRLRQRAAASDPAWLALSGRCNAYLSGHVEWPDGADYPAAGSIGEGYQGSDYFEPLVQIGLCYQTALSVDPPRAQRFGDKGVDILVKMSEPSGPHAVNPLRDSGYGIRFFGLGMAIGYDWFHEALSGEQRARVSAALSRWIDAYEQKGFGREHPQGNYFAGYYAAKALAALAVKGDSPQAEAQWRDWLERVHRGMVQPYYAAHLRGGGWPEGWNYGPLATLNMSWPALVSKSAAGVDLVHDPRAPFLFPVEQGAHLIHFTWPSRRTLDDRQIQYEGDNPAAAQPFLYTVQAGLLRMLNDPLAPTFQAFARAIRAAQKERAAPWQEFLFWDEAAPERDFRSLPLSYLAGGMSTAAVRSSWEPDAVWGSFTAGPYVNYSGSGEQYYDQGSLAIVRGARPLLVNAPAALMRHHPGTEDGRKFDDLIYNEIYEKGNRGLFNIFYANHPKPYGQGAYSPTEARTRVDLFEDHGGCVAVRGRNLEEMYRRDGRSRVVTSWSRSVVYLRPDLFVVYDHTAVDEAGRDQWMAFHFPERPTPVRAGGGPQRFDIGAGPDFAGSITPLLPQDPGVSVVDVFNRHKVFRLDVRPKYAGQEQRWLTVLQPAAAPRALATVARLSAGDGNVQAGGVVGVHLGLPGEGRVVLFAEAGEGKDPGEISYVVPAAPAAHVVLGLPPNRGFSVTASSRGKDLAVRIIAGAGPKSSAGGVVRFRVKEGGVVQGAW